ncbi:hypothetical protein ACFL1M_00490 [Patescibacteria group bacterium]
MKKNRPVRSAIRKLYKTHGALTFLLAFYPMIPNVVEAHTKGYLLFTRALSGSIGDIREVIQILFGSRGVKEYEEYKRNNPDQILPEHIFEKLHHEKKLGEALKMIQKMFFDRPQRNFQHADKMRAAVILSTPEVLRQHPQDKFKSFRSKLIRLVSNQAIIDQAIPSQLAFIQVALRLLTQIERHNLEIEKEKLHAMFAGIEAKIKAELAGKASAYTAPIRPYKDKKKDPILLSEENALNLHQVLLLLAVSPALEVREDAKEAIIQIESFKDSKIS